MPTLPKEDIEFIKDGLEALRDELGSATFPPRLRQKAKLWLDGIKSNALDAVQAKARGDDVAAEAFLREVFLLRKALNAALGATEVLGIASSERAARRLGQLALDALVRILGAVALL